VSVELRELKTQTLVLISQNLGPFLKSKGVEAIIEIDDK
jgi:hypothetical protein